MKVQGMPGKEVIIRTQGNRSLVIILDRDGVLAPVADGDQVLHEASEHRCPCFCSV